MKKIRKMKQLYKRVAKEHGVTSKCVEGEIAKAIREAWSAPEGSPQKESQLKYFPNGNPPSNEEYIAVIIKELAEEGIIL